MVTKSCFPGSPAETHVDCTHCMGCLGTSVDPRFGGECDGCDGTGEHNHAEAQRARDVAAERALCFECGVRPAVDYRDGHGVCGECKGASVDDTGPQVVPATLRRPVARVVAS